MDKKKKKILIGAVAALLVVATVAAVFLIPRTPTDEVFVYSFDLAGYVNYYESGTESYGMVTTDRVQAEYVSTTKTVTEILVYQGQTVKKGDVLYRYDTTLSDMEIEKKELSIQQMELNLKSAKAELKTLNSLKAMVIPDEPEESEDEDTTTIPKDAVEGKPFSGTGKTKNTAYRVWLKSSTSVTEDMIVEYLGTSDSVYVVFCYSKGNKAGAEITQEMGIRFIRSVREEPTDPTEGSSEATDPTEGSSETTDPTEGSSEATDPTEGSSEATDPTEGSSETTDPTEGGSEATDPTEDGSESTNPQTRAKSTPKMEEFIDMRFFTPSSSSDSTSENIVWNSGYTSAELTAMKAEKNKEIDELNYNIKIGKAELAIMKKEADNGEVVAEFDGTVTSVLEPENAAAMNAPMVKVSGGGGFYVEGSVSELDLATIQVGQTVTVTSWDTYMTYEGTVVEIGQYPTDEGNYDSYGASNVSYYPYKVFIDESADLQEGYYVSMTYQAQTSEEGVMYLENAFVLTENGASYVYVRGEDGLLEKRQIQVGDNSNGYMTKIASGLSQTDYIAFPYGKNVVEGAPTVEGTWDDLYNN